MDGKAQMQKDKQKGGSPRIVIESLGEPSEISEKVAKTPSMVTPTVLPTLEKNLDPRGGEVLEEKMNSNEYPFRRELEELLCSPKVGPKAGVLLEEGEIDVTNPLLGSPTTQKGDN